jgi:hypothetical protein
MLTAGLTCTRSPSGNRRTAGGRRPPSGAVTTPHVRVGAAFDPPAAGFLPSGEAGEFAGEQNGFTW